MIKLRLIRSNPKDINQEYTHGELFLRANNGTWLDFCFTIEDKVRDINMNGEFDGDEKKVYGKTAIPFTPKGKSYKGFLRLSPKRNRVVPELKNVSGFKNIQIHSGNTADDSLGCIIVGYNTDNNGKVWNSRKAESDLVNLIQQNDLEGNFKLEII